MQNHDFNRGDWFVILNLVKHSKLQLVWESPFVVEQKLRGVNYLTDRLESGL